jgi:hypothetical protein
MEIVNKTNVTRREKENAEQVQPKVINRGSDEFSAALLYH